MGAKTKGNILILTGALFLVWTLYQLSTPLLLTGMEAEPVKDRLAASEFVAKPVLSEGRVETTKDLLKAIFGYSGGKSLSFLIFPQDSLEMRPTGGFPGTYLFVKARQGKIETLVFDDIWKFDLPLESANKPQLNQYAWWAHFPRGAKYAMDVYKTNTGNKVDGVITVDPAAIKYLLEAIGPVEVPAAKVTVDGANVIDQILSRSPYIKATSGPARHKAFMGEIVEAIKGRLSDYDTLAKRDAIAVAFLKGLEEKHILLYFNDPKLRGTISDHRWDGAIDKDDSTDFLAVRDYNAGINKVDLYIDRDINYTVDLDGAQGPTAKLRIEYRYNYDKNLYDKYGDLASPETRQHKNILRVYTPRGAKLLDSAGFVDYVKSDVEDGRQVFEGLVALDPQSVKTVSLEYALPAKIKDTYSLVLSKQPGLPMFGKKAPTVDVAIRRRGRSIDAYYPDYTKYSAQTIEFMTNLEYDRFVKLRFNSPLF